MTNRGAGTAIRQARAEDAGALAVLIDISNAGADGPDLTAAEANILAPGSDVHFSLCIVADPGGEPAAAMVLNRVARAIDADGAAPIHRPFETLKQLVPDHVYIRNLASLPHRRGEGLARSLVAVAVAAGEASGAPGVCAIVHRSNEAMRGLMERCGFASAAHATLETASGYEAGSIVDLWVRPAG